MYRANISHIPDGLSRLITLSKFKITSQFDRIKTTSLILYYQNNE